MHYESFMPKSPYKSKGTFYSCFITVASYQQCMSTIPEFVRESRMKDCKPNALVTGLVGLVLKIETSVQYFLGFIPLNGAFVLNDYPLGNHPVLNACKSQV